MTPWVQRLIFANIAMYFFQMTAASGGGSAARLEQLLVFVPVLTVQRPWSVITYMFLHGSIMHILFNMMGLWFFGPRVEARIGSSRFASLYFLSGISGAIFSFIFAPTSPIIGASAGVFGVMMAFATFWPRDEILIWGIVPVQARWLVILTTGFAIYSGLAGSQGGVADFAHLGGYAGAWCYLRLINSPRGMKKFKKRATGNVPEKALGNYKQLDLGSVHEINRDEVNRILDKISASGINSLTPQERVFLSNFVPLDDRKPPVS